MSTTSPKLLGTPSVADAMGGHLSRGGDRKDELLLKGEIKALLPTPKATNNENRPGTDRHGVMFSLNLGQTVQRHLTSSSAAIPVSPSAPQDAAPATPIRDTSGPSSPVLLASFDPDTRCWRTFQATLASELPRFSQTLPRSGMTRRGRLYELRTSALPTVGNGGSALLGTPEANQRTQYPRTLNNGAQPLANQVDVLLHSPTASDKDGMPRYDHRASPGYVRAKPVPNLAAQIVDELLPTPDATHGRKTTRTSDLLPEVVSSLGDLTNQPSEGGNE